MNARIRFLIVFAALISVICPGMAGKAPASPVDLSGFSSDPSASISGGTVTLEETPYFSSVFCYNDNFQVPQNGGIFSFTYALDLGTQSDNSLFFQLQYADILLAQTSSSGTYSVDLTPYGNTAISVAWGLIWNGDPDSAGAVATISNVDLSPVPLPPTIWLLGCGLAVLCKFRKTK